MSRGFVYVIHAVGTDRVKIGYSAEPEKRLADLQTASPFPLALIGKREGAPDLERRFHRHLSEYRRIGEWFEFDPQEALSLLSQISQNDEPLDREIMAAIALAHLSMLTQAAKKEIRMLPEDAESRQAWLIGFISTGAGIVSEENRRLAQQINDFLSTQSGTLSTQPEQERRTA
jgi:hypothetical protein